MRFEQIHANKLATIIFLYLLFHCLKLLFRLFKVYLFVCLLARSLVILALLHVRCAISLLSILLLLLLLMVFFCCCLVRPQLSMCGVIVCAVLSCEYLLFIIIYVTLCFSQFIYFVQSITEARISIRHSNCVCIVFIYIFYTIASMAAVNICCGMKHNECLVNWSRANIKSR